MKSFQRTILASAAALLTLASWSAQAAPPQADMSSIETPTGENGPITRAQVRRELAQWRAAGLLDESGEASTSTQVLAAREKFNQQMAVELYARLEREQQQQLAAAEAARQLQAQRDEAAQAAAARRAEGALMAASPGEPAIGTPGTPGSLAAEAPMLGDDAGIVSSQMPLDEQRVPPVAAGELLIDDREAMHEPVDSTPTPAEREADPMARREDTQ